MSKKLIFGLILAFIGVFAMQHNAHADAGACTMGSSYTAVVSGTITECPANNHPKTCSVGTATANCATLTQGGTTTHAICNATSCKPGYKLVPDDTLAGWYTGMCGMTTSSDVIAKFLGRSDCKQCDIGTYSDGGTATSCTPCPSNTYGGGGGYSSCKSCPANATCSGANFTCDPDYYKDGDGCTQCPLADGIYTNSARTSAYQARYTSAKGATSIKDCYLPSGTTYYDAKGTFTFNTTCNYE